MSHFNSNIHPVFSELIPRRRYYSQQLPQTLALLDYIMKAFQKTVFHFLAHMIIAACGQQFEGTFRGIGYPGLSDGCLNALNTTIKACPLLLADAALDNPRLNSEQLTELCTASCYSSLSSVRDTISVGCNAPNDTIEFDSVVYPGNLHLSCCSKSC